MVPNFELFLFALSLFLLVLSAGALPFLRTISAEPKVLYSVTCIAAGFLISAAMLVAIPEGFMLFLEGIASNASQHQSTTHDHGHHGTAGLIAGAAVLLGFVFMLILEGLGFGHDVHEEHHDHLSEHSHDHINHPEGQSTSVVIGLTMHALMDGVVLAAAYSVGEMLLTVQLALVILMHKFPAAFSLSAFSLHERDDRRRSFFDLLLFAAATPLVMLLSVNFFVVGSQQWQGLVVLFAAGSFIYVSAVDVLPSIHIRGKSRLPLMLVLLGVLLMLTMSFVLASAMETIHH